MKNKLTRRNFLNSMTCAAALATDFLGSDNYWVPERQYVLREISEERKKTAKEVLESFLHQSVIEKDLVVAVESQKNVPRQRAYETMRKYHAEKIVPEKSKPKLIPYGKDEFIVEEQYDGARPLIDMISNPDAYLASINNDARENFNYSQIAKIENLPTEKIELIRLRFGRLFSWNIDKKNVQKADKLILHMLSQFYEEMIIPGPERCLKKTKKNNIIGIFNRDILTMSEKLDFIKTLNSPRL